MSEREVRRAGVLQRVKSKDLKLVEAAEILGLSYRQAKRQYQRYRQGGSKALVHGNAGKPSNQAKPEKLRRRALALVKRHYGGEPGERFGPTLAAEHLAEDHQVEVDAETLRRWMLAEGLWTRERKRKPFRQRRERRWHFGELVQMDGSFEYWLEGRGPKGCLLHMVDEEQKLRALRAAASLLLPGGRLVFDVFAPSREDIEETDGLWLEREPGIFERADWDLRTRTLALSVRGSEEATTFELHWLSAPEWHHLIEEAGFVVDDLYGWFDRRPYEGGEDQIWVCRRPR